MTTRSPDFTPAKKPVKAAPKKAAAAPPAGISAADWQQVQQVAKAQKVDPYLLVAIGVHETQWGTQGAGRPSSQGGASNILGYGAFDSNPNNPQYSGLTAQLNGAAQLLASHGVHTVNDLAAYQRQHGANVYGATDPGWSAGVISTYGAVKGGTVDVGSTGPIGSDGQSAAQEFTANPDLVGSQGTYNSANSTYGYLGAFLHDKRIGPLILDAAAQGWDSNRMLGALRGGKDPVTGKTYKAAAQWWKTTAATARTFDAQMQLDPASQKQVVANKAAAIAAQAAADGVTVSQDRVNQMATDSLRYNWDTPTLNKAIAAEYHYNSGQTNVISEQVKQIANSNLVPLSDKTVQDWTQQILGSPDQAAALDQFKVYSVGMAKSRWPSLSAYLDSSPDATVQTFIHPYAQDAAQLTDQNPDQINFLDPKWSALIDQVDPKTGIHASLSRSDAITKIKTDPVYGYDKSTAAQQDVNGIISTIKSGMGLT